MTISGKHAIASVEDLGKCRTFYISLFGIYLKCSENSVKQSVVILHGSATFPLFNRNLGICLDSEPFCIFHIGKIYCECIFCIYNIFMS